MGNYLQGYAGHLQVNGYSSYEQTDTTLVGCIVHTRRQFMDVKKTQGKGKPDWAMVIFDELYCIEKDFKHRIPTERQAIWQEKACPLLQQLKDWLEKSLHQVTPRNTMDKPLNTVCANGESRCAILEDSELKIDNNRAKRAVKPFVIGQKTGCSRTPKWWAGLCGIVWHH